MKTVALIPIIYFALAAGIYVFQPLKENNWMLEQMIFDFASLFAAITAFLALQTYGRGSRFASLLSLGLGLVTWFIADVVFSYLEFVTKSLTFPSIADYFYLAGYLLFFAGLVLEARAADVAWKKLSKRVYLAAGGFSALMFAIFSYLTIFVSYTPDAPFGENLVTIGYTVGDLFVVIGSFFTIILAWEYRGGKASRVWISLFLGFLTTMIADLLFATFTQEGLEGTGFFYIVPQLTYILGYMFMIYAYGLLRKTLREFQMRPRLHDSQKTEK